MSPRSFALLLLATVASVGLAGWAVSQREAPLTAVSEPAPMFEGLLSRLNDVSTIRVTAGGQTTTLQKGLDGVWTIAERGGYPADPERVRELALAFANLRLVEPKTGQAERLARLDLDDPTGSGGRAREVVLLDKEDKPLAAAVIGKTRFGLYGGGRAGVYVRRSGEDQAWLAAGELTVPATPIDFVNKEIIDISADEVARVTLAIDDAAPLVVSKPDRAAEDFTLEGTVPEGRSADPDKLDRIAGALSSLTLQDVRPAAELTVPADARRSVFETWDGTRIDMTLVPGERDAEVWAIFAVIPGTASPSAPPSDAEAPGASEGVEAANRLAAHLEGWAFKLPEFAARRLGGTIEDLLAPAGSQPAS